MLDVPFIISIWVCYQYISTWRHFSNRPIHCVRTKSTDCQIHLLTCGFWLSGKTLHKVCPSWGSAHPCTKYSYGLNFFLSGVHVHFFSKGISCREKKYISVTWIFFKIIPAVSQQPVLMWHKYYTLPNYTPLITTNLLGCFNCSFFKVKKFPEPLHLSIVHVTQCSALSVSLTLDSPPVMPVKSLGLSQWSKFNHTTEVKSHPIRNTAVAELPKHHCSCLTCSSSYSAGCYSLESGRAEETKKCHVTFSLAGVIPALHSGD